MFKTNGLLLATALAIAGSVQPSHAVTDVFATYRNSGLIASGSPIATLHVPSGRYAIFAKINLDQDDPASVVTPLCTLQADNDLDRDNVRLAASGLTRLDQAALPLQVVHTFLPGSTGNIVLFCTFNPAQSSNLFFRFAKITAIRIDGLPICNEPSPAVCP